MLADSMCYLTAFYSQPIECVMSKAKNLNNVLDMSGDLQEEEKKCLTIGDVCFKEMCYCCWGV